jgi:peptidoglycan hydrolase CwlO-like protein
LNLNDLKKTFEEVTIEPLDDEIRKTQSNILNNESKIEQLNYQQQQTNLLVEANNSEIADLNKINKELSGKIDVLISAIEKEENTKYQHERARALYFRAGKSCNSLTAKRESTLHIASNN